MDYVQIRLHTILILVLGLLFTPKTNLSASTRIKNRTEQAKPITSDVPEKDLDQQLSDLYAKGVIAISVDSLPEKALEIFNSVLDLDSMHSPTLYEIASYYLDKDKDIALEYINRAIDADSTCVEYKNILARIYIMDRKYDAAAKIFEQLNKLEPNNQFNYHILSSLYIENKMPFAALTLLDSAQSRFGKAYEISATKRDLFATLKMFDKAIVEAQDIATDYPLNVDNLLALAELYGIQKNDSLATKTYNDARTLDSDNIKILMSMSDFYSRNKNNTAFLNTVLEIMKSKQVELDQKIEIFNSRVKNKEMYQGNYLQVNSIATTFAILYPDDMRAMNLYASHLVSSGDAEQAVQIYKDRLRIDDKNIDVYNNIIDLEAYLNRADSVEKYSNLALELDPKNLDLHLRRSGVFQYQQRFEQASKALKKASKLTDNDTIKSQIYCSLGDIEQFLGNSKKAISYYKQSLKYNSQNILTLNNYSYFLSTIDQDLETAKQMIEIVVAEQSNNPTYLDTQAWILYKLGEYEQAQKIMRSAISLDRDKNIELYVHYGDILHALGQDFMAIIYWRKALEGGYSADEIAKRIQETENK